MRPVGAAFALRFGMSSERRRNEQRLVDKACDTARDLLAVRPPAAGAHLRQLPLADQGQIDGGTKPIVILHDDEGRRWVFKRADPALLAAEECAYLLRRLGCVPCVPAMRMRVALDGDGDGDGEERDGILKPFLEIDADARLREETSTWTDLQRAVVFREHAWEHFLGNLDANTSQYVLIGPDAVPVNLDWDRAFTDVDDGLSRFKKYRPLLPNARTFLYADYVAGRIDLPLHLLEREANRIRSLPTHEVRAIVARVAAARFPDDVMGQRALIAHVLRVQRKLPHTAARFVRDLRRERHRILRPANVRARVEAWIKRAWSRWQLVLQHAGRGPLGTWGRRALRVMRARRLT